jgi:hypothetical protein
LGRACEGRCSFLVMVDGRSIVKLCTVPYSIQQISFRCPHSPPSVLAYDTLLRHLQRTRSSFTLAAFVFSRVGSSYFAHHSQRSCFTPITRHASLAIVRGWLDHSNMIATGEPLGTGHGKSAHTSIPQCHCHRSMESTLEVFKLLGSNDITRVL